MNLNETFEIVPNDPTDATDPTTNIIEDDINAPDDAIGKTVNLNDTFEIKADGDTETVDDAAAAPTNIIDDDLFVPGAPVNKKVNLNDTFEVKHDVPADSTFTTTNILDGDLHATNPSINNIIDGTKTMVISKNRTRPNLPEAKTQRKHHRRSTFSVDDNHVSSDVANMITSVKLNVPEDDEQIRQAIKHEVMLYIMQKDKKHAKDILAIRHRAEVMRISRQTSAASSEPSPPPSETISEEDIVELERKKAEVREKHVESLRLIGILAQEAQKFADAEWLSINDDITYDNAYTHCEKIYSEFKHRYTELLAEGKRKCDIINDEIKTLDEKHSESNATVENNIASSEIAIKNYGEKIADLTKQRAELLEMVDNLMEKIDDDAPGADF